MTHNLARISRANPSRARNASIKNESAQNLSGDRVLRHSEVDKFEQIRGLPTIDTCSMNEFVKCGLDLAVARLLKMDISSRP